MTRAVDEETSTGSSTVTVYWTATPPNGNQSCVETAPVDVPLHLAAPPRQRALLDGSTPAKAPVTRYAVDANE